jgi:hypothetical protein
MYRPRDAADALLGVYHLPGCEYVSHKAETSLVSENLEFAKHDLLVQK